MAMSATRKTITTEAAARIVKAAEEAAVKIGVPMVIAVTDESGTLKSFVRMDGAALLSVTIAQDKAFTAASFSMPTHQWFEFIKDDPPLLHGIVHTPRLVVFGGGYPIKEGGAVIGAIGVSGGHYHQDMSVAKAALEAVGLPADA